MNREDRQFVLDLLRLTEPRGPLPSLRRDAAPTPAELSPRLPIYRELAEMAAAADLSSIAKREEKCEQLKLDLIERARNGYGCVACYSDHVEWTPQPHVREVRSLPPRPGLFYQLSTFALKVLTAAALVSAGMWLAGLLNHGHALR